MTQRLTLVTMILAIGSAVVTMQPLRAQAVRAAQECAVITAVGVAPIPAPRDAGA
jgi:hypothetical protein